MNVFTHYAESIYQYSLALFQTAPFMVIWWYFAVFFIVITLPEIFLRKPIFSLFMGVSGFFGWLISAIVCTLSISFHDNFWWLFFAFQLSWGGFFLYITIHMDRVYSNSDGGMALTVPFFPWLFTSPLAILIHVVYKYVLGY